MLKMHQLPMKPLRTFTILSCFLVLLSHAINETSNTDESTSTVSSILVSSLLTSKGTDKPPSVDPPFTNFPLLHKPGNHNLSFHNSTFLSSGDKPFSSEALTTSPINDKITHTIQTEFSKLFKESSGEGRTPDNQKAELGAKDPPRDKNAEDTLNKGTPPILKSNPTQIQKQVDGRPKLNGETKEEGTLVVTQDGSQGLIENENNGQEEDGELYLEGKAFEYERDETFPTLEMRQAECLYSMSEDSVAWRRGTRTLKIILPHIESMPCVPPLKCKVSTTVNKKVYLQDGDSLKVMLRLPITQEVTSPPTVPNVPVQSDVSAAEYDKMAEPESFTNKEEATVSSVKYGSNSQMDGANLHSNATAKAHQLKTREAQHSQGRNPPELGNNFIFKRSLDYGDIYASGGSEASSLTIWKVTESEWTSCSTREGGQVSLSDKTGIATIQDTDLPPGKLFFIGRSSWSSSECFKLKIIVRSADCGEGSICSGKGRCYANSSMEEFGCGCCHGYAGKHCEERNACVDNPCLNSGICVDIQEGHDGSTFQCLCRYGYGGKFCELTMSLCNSQPCQNGGYCEGNHTAYICRCAPGWMGPTCSEESRYPYGADDVGEDVPAVDYNTRSSLTGCNESPCVHGVCIQTTQKDFRCFCQQGFGGERCEMEYNECDSDPCFNGATCVDQIGSFECLCDSGYTGPLCRIKVDLCNSNPCPMDKECVDKGNSYSCECLQGITADDCSESAYLQEQLCVPNPCAHGGTCNVLADSTTPYCACKPEYTGLNCQGIIDSSDLRYSEVNNLDQSDVLIKVTNDRSEHNFGDAFVLESVGPVGTLDPAKDVEMRHSPFRGPLTHMRNLYTAAVTLTCAFVIFLLVVSVCHCRMNKPYSKCFLFLPKRPQLLPTFNRIHFTSLRDKKRRERLNSLRFECDPDGASVPMTSQTTAENTYYNMDASDNQELPLIK